MKQRILPFLATGVLLALTSASLAAWLQAGNSGAAGWLHAHITTPALWIVDGLSLLVAIAFVYIGALRISLGNQMKEVRRIREEHTGQLDALITQSESLEVQNSALDAQCVENARQIAEMEEQARTRNAEFDRETRRLTEQVLTAVRSQTEANAQQLQAVNMALRYQRSELRQMRHGLNEVKAVTGPAQIARLSPAEFAAINSGISPEEFVMEDEEGDFPPLDLTVNGLATVVMETLDYEIGPTLAIVHSAYQNATDKIVSDAHTSTEEDDQEASDPAREAIG